jgi:O-antigen/teichoic acid export membrane protein
LLWLGQGLFELIALRVLASAIHCALLGQAIARLQPQLRWRWPDPALRADLLGFSAYACLSRFASLSYAHADKLIIGALAGVMPLAYFTVAATLANRVLALSFRLSSVFFPAASALAAGGAFERLDRVYLKATRYVVYLNASLLVLLAVFAYPILARWMGADFARHGAAVLALMALAQFIDALTNLPSLVNDGIGHPRLSGLFALARALAGLACVYLGVAGWGIVGAAWGHLAAAAVFTLAFVCVVHGRTVPTGLARLCRHGYLPGMSVAAAVALAGWLAQHWLADRAYAGLPTALSATLSGTLHHALSATLPAALSGAGSQALPGVAAIAALTVCLLGVLGFVFVVEPSDRRLVWGRLKALAGA